MGERKIIPTVVRAMYDKHARVEWLGEIVKRKLVDNELTEDDARKLMEQAATSRFSPHLRDLVMTTVVAHIATKPLSLPTSLAMTAWAFENSNPLVGFYAWYMHVPIFPKINFDGVFRAIYMGAIATYEHLKYADRRSLPSAKSEAALTGLALISPFGNLVSPLRMRAEYPELSTFLERHFKGEIIKGFKRLSLVSKR